MKKVNINAQGSKLDLNIKDGCQPRVIISTNLVGLTSLMLHSTYKTLRLFAFRSWRRFLKDFTIYGHGSHLGHVTRDSCTCNLTLFGQLVSEETIFKIVDDDNAAATGAWVYYKLPL